MDTIWTIVNNQDKEVINYFEELYMCCIIKQEKFSECEIVKLWKDLTELNSRIEKINNLKNLELSSIELKMDNTLKGYIDKKNITLEDIQYIKAHYLKDYTHLSKAITIFDSYFKSIAYNKKKFHSDNRVKIAIAILTALTTLFSVWLGFNLKSGREERPLPNPYLNSYNIYIIQDSLNIWNIGIDTIHSDLNLKLVN